jgi:hypothetical protein
MADFTPAMENFIFSMADPIRAMADSVPAMADSGCHAGYPRWGCPEKPAKKRKKILKIKAGNSLQASIWL